MLFVVAVTVAALAASVFLALAGWGAPVAVAHLAFAVGIVPLIFAAMSHFVPVLTRTGQPARAIAGLPVLAQTAGFLAVAAMQGLLPRWTLHVAATADWLAAAVLLVWIVRRARACLGAPHPGWRWYGAALVFLLAALAVVPLLAVPGGAYAALRAFHLHANTLGLVGLAALGTLPVLLPTALGRPDPAAAAWLRRRLWPAVAAIAAVAAGAALAWPLALIGAAILLFVLAGLARQWLGAFGGDAIRRDGAAASLVAATLGCGGLLLLGAAHGAGLIPARPAIAAWGAGFLLPLVTGALSQLLPVWRWPGPATPARAAMRQRLAAGGQARAMLFVGAGVLLALDLPSAGGALVALGLAFFLASLAQAMRVAAPAR